MNPSRVKASRIYSPILRIKGSRSVLGTRSNTWIKFVEIMSEPYRTQSIEMDSTVTLFREQGGGIDSFEGQIVSVSPGSMGLRANKPVSPDHRMQLMLTFIDREGGRSRESVQGWVVWQDERPPFYLLGVIFPEINERENPKLTSYLSEESSTAGESVLRSDLI